MKSLHMGLLFYLVEKQCKECKVMLCDVCILPVVFSASLDIEIKVEFSV